MSIWLSPPISDARLTGPPEMLVALWCVIAANRAYQQKRNLTWRGLLISSPLAALAITGWWMLFPSWIPS